MDSKLATLLLVKRLALRYPKLDRNKGIEYEKIGYFLSVDCC